METPSKEHIFEAITMIKKSRNKPNASRICGYMFKNHKISENRVIKILNQLTKSGDLVTLAVGADTTDVSYKIADTPPPVSLASEEDLPGQGSVVYKVLAEMIINEPVYLDSGVPPAKLVEFISEKQPNMSKDEIHAAIQLELKSGNLDVFDNGHYGYKPSETSEDEDDDSNASSNEPPAKTTTTATTTTTKSKKQSSPQRQPEKSKPTTNGREIRKSHKKRNIYAKQDSKYISGSKDFKVDISLERQARKRKEKKIFDPSNYDAPPIKKSKNGRTLSQDNKDVSSHKNGSSSSNSQKQLLSPKKYTTSHIDKSHPVVPPGGRVNITPSVPASVCMICQSYGKRVKGVPEKLVPCSKCAESKVHVSCLENTKQSPEKLAGSTVWICKACKEICVYCNQKKDTNSNGKLACIQCNSFYHVSCHRGLVPRNMSSFDESPANFKCIKCISLEAKKSKTKPVVIKEEKEDQPPPSVITEKEQKLIKSVNAVDVKPTIQTTAPSIQSNKNGHKDLKLNIKDLMATSPVVLHDPYECYPIDTTIPDVSSWNTCEVYEFFKKHFSIDVCQVLFDMEIDGTSLLLLKRVDVLKNMNLKLGNALKLYAFIKKLQIRRSCHELFWE